MPEPCILETPRLRLRQWRDADYAPFAALNADTRVMRHFPAPLDATASNALADRCRALISERGWDLWALETKEDGAFIGFAGLHVPPMDLPFSPCVEIGWRMAHGAWGKGYTTEAAGAALHFGFGRLDLSEVVSYTAVGNTRSRAVMERLGMRFDRLFSHPALPEGSPLREHCLYRLSRVQYSFAPAGSVVGMCPPRGENNFFSRG